MERAVCMLKEAFDNSFIINNLENCNEILSLKEDVLEELEALQPQDFETAKLLLCELTKVYANAADVLSYCICTVANIIAACESMVDNG